MHHAPFHQLLTCLLISFFFFFFPFIEFSCVGFIDIAQGFRLLFTKEQHTSQQARFSCWVRLQSSRSRGSKRAFWTISCTTEPLALVRFYPQVLTHFHQGLTLLYSSPFLVACSSVLPGEDCLGLTSYSPSRIFGSSASFFVHFIVFLTLLLFACLISFLLSW